VNLGALFDGVAGNPLVSRVAAGALGAQLRVLAYHEIRDVAGFRSQIEYLAERYRPVSTGDVIAWLGGRSLPNRAVWVTFDDGDPSVVEDGLAILQTHDVPATMFVCPGVVDTVRPYWWQIVEAVAPDRVGPLKAVPDAERVAEVARWEELITERDGAAPRRAQLTSAQLGRWIDAGQDVGNHTWDHPMLDQCSAEEQRRQVRDAHGWLRDRVDPEHLVFAYPNGNVADESAALLARLGYSVDALFDHRMCPKPVDGRLSRLRVNADANEARFRSIVSGLHPLIHAHR
jgi:peptidoglycan/xylan/chitin deacetylase (PgdA/CDA1 family)